MKLSAEIKQYFKKLGIPVRVRTVAVKNPFVQVWIESTGDIKTPEYPYGKMVYDHEFPIGLRQNLLKIIYGNDFPEKQKALGCSDSSAGNVQSNRLSFSESEWRELMARISN
jgi:hypothetical protein